LLRGCWILLCEVHILTICVAWIVVVVVIILWIFGDPKSFVEMLNWWTSDVFDVRKRCLKFKREKKNVLEREIKIPFSCGKCVIVW
jgi:hypothetical protein